MAKERKRKDQNNLPPEKPANPPINRKVGTDPGLINTTRKEEDEE
jgi:hypothetical protein